MSLPAPEPELTPSPPPANHPVDDGTPEDDDVDSAFGDAASSTVSISSSILRYRELHGRTYQNYGTTEYWGPNDERQNEQLDLGHHMVTMLLDDKLFLAPIGDDVDKVLDIGTGTGIWAIDFADQFPASTVIGTDLSPIQPSWIPPNVRFEIDDAQLDWTYPESYFDFIHIRCLMGSISDWPRLFQQAYQSMKPGGWIESLEMDIQFTSDDGTVTPGHTMYDWSQLFIDAGEKMGRTFLIPRQSRKLLEDAGFVDLHSRTYKMPVGSWMEDDKWREIGQWNLLYLTTGLEGMALYILKNVLGWEYPEIQALTGRMRQALKDKRNHGYYEITVVYGRRP